jgi:hypothetical protein
MIRTLAAVAALTAALAAPSAVDAHGKLPTGRYNCYVFLSTQTYTGRYIVIKSAHKYVWFDSKKKRSGKYSHLASGKLKFKSGPLKGLSGRHHVYGNGHQGVDIVFKTDSGPSDYACSHT